MDKHEHLLCLYAEPWRWRGYLAERGIPPDERDDIIQAAVLKMLTVTIQPTTYGKREKQVKALWFQTLRNLAIDWHRRRLARKTAPAGDMSSQVTQTDDLEIVDELIDLAAADLPERVISCVQQILAGEHLSGADRVYLFRWRRDYALA